LGGGSDAIERQALRSFALAAWLCCILSVAWYPRQTEYLGGFESEQDAVNWTKFKYADELQRVLSFYGS
jgi:hypothetical protein